MAERKVHNKIAAMFSNLSYKEIDEINKEIDRKDMLEKYGKNHRKYWGHDWDAGKPDSRAINRGNPEREKVRRIHILVDTDPEIKRILKRQEIREKLKKFK
jgi:parvulin-like peptidyl-prolyl isomerase